MRQYLLSPFRRFFARFAIAGAICLAPAFAQAQPESASDASHAIRDILDRAHAPHIDVATLNLAALRSFYDRRLDAPAWSGNPAAAQDAKTMLAALEHADEDGLDPFAYHAGAAAFRIAPQTGVEQAERDILLTDGALRYVRELRAGRAELRALDRDVDLPEQPFDAVGALEAALEARDLPMFLAGLAPPHPEYQRLKAALATYRRIAAAGGWLPLPPLMKGNIAAGDAGPLRARLALEDDQAVRSDTPDELAEALKRFQLRHGLDGDGRLVRETLVALNVSASDRAMEIEANMERWRWLPRTLEPVRIVINAAAGELDVASNGESVLSSRVIVGRPQAPTPILRAVATSVTVNPPWNVPSAIARREIWPKLKKNRHYLQSEDMILVNGPPGDPQGLDIDWRGLNAFPYRVRQLPGPRNALGQIKLELPNRFDVYLHDTPAKEAFELNERNLSHGCVRVQQILPLASYALSSDASAMVAELEKAMASGATEHIAMTRPLPVYFLYWTSFVDADGTVEFRPDVYGRDERLIAQLESRKAGESFTLALSGCART